MRQLKLADGLPPLLTLVESYRLRCDVPVVSLAKAAGVSLMTYHNWMKGHTVPRKRNERVLLRAGKALKSLFDEGELPVPRSQHLTRLDRESKIEDILLRRVEKLEAQ